MQAGADGASGARAVQTQGLCSCVPCGQGPLTGAMRVGAACGPWPLSPAPEGHLVRLPRSRARDSLRMVLQCRGLALRSSGKLQHVRIPASTVSTLCVLPKDLGSFPDGSDGKERACSAGDLHSILVLGRPPGGGHDSPLQYSCWRTVMARGAWRAAVMGPQRQPRLSIAQKTWGFLGSWDCAQGEVRPGRCDNGAGETGGPAEGPLPTGSAPELLQREWPPRSHQPPTRLIAIWQ